MDAGAYTFDSTAELRLTELLGFPGVRTPIIKLAGPTTVARSASTAPAPGRFRAETRLVAMNLHGRFLGLDVSVTLNGDYGSIGAIEGRADPQSPNPSQPEPIGSLNSTFDVYINVATPIFSMYNKEPIQVQTEIKSVPPSWAKYRQYSLPRDMFDRVMGLIIAQAQHAAHVVKLEPAPGGGSGE